MQNVYLPTKALALPSSHLFSIRKYFISLLWMALFTMLAEMVAAQGIVVNQRMSLVFNGNITMVVNNGFLKNNGALVESKGTVIFSGDKDTLTSYIAGSSKTIFYNLSITKSAYGVALKSGVGVRNVMAVTGGNLYTDSNLTLISDAALTARVDVVPATSLIIGKAHVERYIPARRAWRLLTAPVTSSNSIYNTWQNRGVYTKGIGTLVTGTSPTGASGNGLDVSYQNHVSLKMWNGATQALINVNNTHVAISPRNTGKADNCGYFVFVRGDRDPANTIVPNKNTTTLTSIGALQTGNQVFTTSSTANSYTLIGNPYASPIDFNKVTRSNLVKRFYVWDPKISELGGYVMMDDLNNDGIYVKTVSASAQTKDLQSSQAFFVETKDNGESQIVFSETNKSGNDNNVVFRPQTPATPTGAGVGEIRTNLYLLQTDNNTIIADGVIAEFDNIYGLQVDRDDALKFGNVNENLAIQRSTSTLAAERRPALTINDTLYFKLTKLVQRNYQFEFVVAGLQQPDITGLLLDSYLNTSTVINLSGTTKVKFTVNSNGASAAANRFKIVFRPIAPLPVTMRSVVAYQKNKNIAVDWKVENEINILKYDVEKSIDGNMFEKVNTTTVAGANNAFNNYSWLDLKAVPGNNFYRIKIYDRSGQITYSSIVKVAIGKTNASYNIFPNPITGNVINLQMNNQPAGTYQLRLTNNIGQTLYTSSVNNNGGNSSFSLNTGSKLPTGIYQLEVIGQENNRNTQKVIVE